jgi:hypothetical protein
VRTCSGWASVDAAAFSLGSDALRLVGIVSVVYAVVEGIEAIGLWYQRRWAEYLTFVVTASLLPLEAYELAHRLSALKVVTIAINLAVVAYLLWAKRLFGLRGGAAAEERERRQDVGWTALQRSTPEAVTYVSVRPAWGQTRAHDPGLPAPAARAAASARWSREAIHERRPTRQTSAT